MRFGITTAITCAAFAIGGCETPTGDLPKDNVLPVSCALDANQSHCDADGDGQIALGDGGEDCNDDDAAVFFGAVEECDGIDNDCNGLIDDDDPEVVADLYYPDADGDSFGDDEAVGVKYCNPPSGTTLDNRDCNDSAESISPDADEVCDAVDNDCNGQVDDGFFFETWYIDADQDGYGDAEDAGTYTCDPPTDGVVTNDDCDDADAAIHPAAAEVCDFIDNDCDLLIDDDDPSLDPAGLLDWYYDLDNDGFGDVVVAAQACSQPFGLVGDNSDCDDDDPTILGPTDWYDDVDGDGFGGGSPVAYGTCAPPVGGQLPAHIGLDCDDGDATIWPGAPEVCDDLIDQSCTGYDAVCPDPGTTGLYDADVKFVGTADGDLMFVGRSAGDFDGDGRADVLLSAQWADGIGPDAGMVYVVPGPDLPARYEVSRAPTRLAGTETTELAGTAISGFGDGDGDGRDDVVIGSWPGGALFAGPQSNVYIVRGGTTGEMDLRGADAVLTSEAPGDVTGRILASVDDMTGNGTPDFATVSFMGGRAYIVDGGVSGPDSLANAAAIFTEEANADFAGGVSPAGAGDVDGDGAADFLLGVPAESSGALMGGAAYLVLGPTNGVASLSTADAKIAGPSAIFNGGATVMVDADLNGDGYDDLVMSNLRFGVLVLSEAYVFYDVLGAPPADMTDADASISSLLQLSWLEFGANLGDVDGDGNDDLAIGDYTGNRAYVFAGPVNGALSLDAADAIFVGEGVDDLAGTTIAGAGDIDGDGLGDLLVGAVNSDGAVENGAVYLLYGAGLGL